MTSSPYPARSQRAGFTLVELLVVIVIIGILAALVTGVAVQVNTAAKQAVIKVEVDQLAMAFKAYKTKYGEYPPNFVDGPAVLRHFRKAFPRMDPTTETALLGDLITAQLTPAEAVVFWLGGFSANPTLPLSGPGGPLYTDVTLRRTSPFLELDQTRLAPGSTSDYWVYHPKGKTQPYVYFDTSRVYATPPVFATIRPYWINSPTPSWVEPKSFQIISAGLDDDWGADLTITPSTFFPEGPFAGGHADNLVSFSTKSLVDSQP